MDVDSQPTMEETILVGDDLMLGPPSPIIPPEIASHVLEGVNMCDGILRNVFLCNAYCPVPFLSTFCSCSLLHLFCLFSVKGYIYFGVSVGTLGLQINDIEPFCQDEIALYRQCAERRDKVLRQRLQDSEHKLGLSMPSDDAKERATLLESDVTSLERRLILASGMEGIEGFRQRWSLHGRLMDTKSRLEALKQGMEKRKKDAPTMSSNSTTKRWFFW